MKKGLLFPIDKLTNSLEDVQTGVSFPTNVQLVSREETITVLRKDRWRFNWRSEFKNKRRKVYKLTLEENDVIQGLVSIEPMPDQLFIELHLIESAPHNLGRKKQFNGVLGNFVAFC